MTLEARLLDNLSRFARGHENARPTEDLCDLFNCTRRQLQKAREALEEEHPILSDQHGYWLATDASEYAEVLQRDQSELKADARRYSRRRRCMRRTWPDYQPSLFEVA